jgi:hypothetical protein
LRRHAQAARGGAIILLVSVVSVLVSGMRAMQARLLWQKEALGSRDEGGNLASPLELRSGLDCQRLVLDVTFHMR